MFVDVHHNQTGEADAGDYSEGWDRCSVPSLTGAVNALFAFKLRVCSSWGSFMRMTFLSHFLGKNHPGMAAQVEVACL